MKTKKINTNLMGTLWEPYWFVNFAKFANFATSYFARVAALLLMVLTLGVGEVWGGVAHFTLTTSSPTLTQGDITISGGKGSNNGYSFDSNGTLTITPNNGVQILSATLIFESSSEDRVGGTPTVNKGRYSRNNSTGRWDGLSSTTAITWTTTNKARVIALTVTYSGCQYYYRGGDNEWGSTAMTVSEDGYYEYYQITGSNTAEEAFKISEYQSSWESWTATTYAKDNWYLDWSDTNYKNCNDKTQNSTWYSQTGKGSDNAKIYAQQPYYILIYYPNTAKNTDPAPRICAKTTLPYDGPTWYYLANNGWCGTGSWELDDDVKMTANPDGSYSKTIPNVTLGNHLFKIATAEWESSFSNYNSECSSNQGTVTTPSDGTGGTNIQFSLATAGDVTITFYPEDGNKICITGPAPAAGYSITYDCDGATSDCPVDVASATVLPNPLPNPVKTGYNFVGWYTNSSKTNEATAGATLSANATLYAKWTPKTYTITLDMNHSESGANGYATAQYDRMSLSDITLPTRTNYHVYGAFYAEPGLTTLISHKDGTLNKLATTYTDETGAWKWNEGDAVTLYTRWVSNTVTVHLVQDAGDPKNQNITFGSALAQIPSSQLATKSYYSLEGYYTQDGSSSGDWGSKLIDAGGNWIANVSGYTDSDRKWIMDDEEITLYPKFVPCVNTVIFDANGGEGVMANQTFTYGEENKALTACTFTKTGYTFAGWARTASGEVACADRLVTGVFTDHTENVTLFAKWTPITTTITLKPNGGEGEDKEMSATFDAVVNPGELEPHAWAGFNLQGYYTAAEGGEYVLSPTLRAKGSIVANWIGASQKWAHPNTTATLYAHWTAATYRIVLNPNGGVWPDTSTEPKDQNETNDKKYSFPAKSPTKVGYKFVGWFTDAENGTQVTTEQYFNVVNDGQVLYAHWEPVYLYVVGRFQVRTDRGNYLVTAKDDSKNGWGLGNKNIRFEFDEENKVYVLNTHMSPAELSAQRGATPTNPWFMLREATTSFQDVFYYKADSEITLNGTNTLVVLSTHTGSADPGESNHTHLRFSDARTAGEVVMTFNPATKTLSFEVINVPDGCVDYFVHWNEATSVSTYFCNKSNYGNSLFEITASGNTKSTNFTHRGDTYNKGVKLDNSTVVSFTPKSDGVVMLYFLNNEAVRINDVSQSVSENKLRLNVTKNATYTIQRGSSENSLYIIEFTCGEPLPVVESEYYVYLGETLELPEGHVYTKGTATPARYASTLTPEVETSQYSDENTLTSNRYTCNTLGEYVIRVDGREDIIVYVYRYYAKHPWGTCAETATTEYNRSWVWRAMDRTGGVTGDYGTVIGADSYNAGANVAWDYAYDWDGLYMLEPIDGGIVQPHDTWADGETKPTTGGNAWKAMNIAELVCGESMIQFIYDDIPATSTTAPSVSNNDENFHGAKVEVNYWTLTFGSTEGGSATTDWGSDSPVKVKEHSKVKFTAAAEDGYTFVGWYTSDTYSGSPISTDLDYVINDVTEDKALYARWKWNQDPCSWMDLPTGSVTGSGSLSDMTTSSLALASVGSAGAGLTIRKTLGVQFNTTNSELRVVLTDGTFVNGTILEIDYKNSSTSETTTGMAIKDSEKENAVSLFSSTGIPASGSGTIIYTFTESNSTYLGKNSIVITRNSGEGLLNISGIRVYRCGEAIPCADVVLGGFKYVLGTTETVCAGKTVTKTGAIVMTYGTEPYWTVKADVTLDRFGYEAYTNGETNPSPTGGSVPTSGTYYKFEPVVDGTLNVAVKINSGKAIYVLEDDTSIGFKLDGESKTSGSTISSTTSGIISFDVKAGSTYYVYCNGSKLALYGFEFVPVVEPTWSMNCRNGAEIHNFVENDGVYTLTGFELKDDNRNGICFFNGTTQYSPSNTNCDIRTETALGESANKFNFTDAPGGTYDITITQKGGTWYVQAAAASSCTDYFIHWNGASSSSQLHCVNASTGVEIGSYSSLFTFSASSSLKEGSVTREGTTYNKGVKLNSDGNVHFTPKYDGVVTLYLSSNSSIKLNNETKTVSGNSCRFDVIRDQEYIITKGSSETGLNIIEFTCGGTVAVTGVSLNKTTTTLEEGDAETLIATVAPADATNKNVSWSSSAEGVATVSSTGVVTAVAPGTATITVTTADGGHTATCEVTVTAAAIGCTELIAMDLNNPGNIGGIQLSNVENTEATCTGSGTGAYKVGATEKNTKIIRVNDVDVVYYKLSGSGYYVGVTLSSGTFQEGDILKVDLGSDYASLNILESKDATTALTTVSAKAGMNEIVLPATTSSSLYIARNGTFDQNPYIASISVCRPSSGVYTVTINPDGGSLTADGWVETAGNYQKTGIAGGTKLALPTPTKTGYYLSGWKDGSSNDVTSPVTVSANMTLTAQWTACGIDDKTLTSMDGTATASVCYGSNTSLKLESSQTGIQYQLMRGNNTAYTEVGELKTGNGGILYWENISVEGSYFVVAYSEHCDKTMSGTVTVTINNPTISQAEGLTEVEVGKTLTLSAITQGGVWTATSNATVLNGVVTGVSAGQATITYRVGECEDTYVVTVTATKTAPTFTWKCDGSGIPVGGLATGGYYVITVEQTGNGTLQLSMPTTAGVTFDAANGHLTILPTCAVEEITLTANSEETATYLAHEEEKVITIRSCSAGGVTELGSITAELTPTVQSSNPKNSLSNTYGWITYKAGGTTLGAVAVEFAGIKNRLSSSTNYYTFSPTSNVSVVELFMYSEKSSVTVSGLYHGANYFASASADGVTSILGNASIAYYNDADTLVDKIDKGNYRIVITLGTEIVAKTVGRIDFTQSLYLYGVKFYQGGGATGDIVTSLAWDADLSSGVTVQTNSVDFAHVATANVHTLGVITYTSSDPTVASVNAATGVVTPKAAGDAVITATLSASGCYQGAIATYEVHVTAPTIVVTSPRVEVSAGIATDKCPEANVTLSATHAGITGTSEPETYQWYRDSKVISGATSATYTTSETGTYSVVISGAKSENSVEVTNREVASIRALYPYWYVKNGRKTQDLATFEIENPELVTDVTISPNNVAGKYSFRYDASEGVVYLLGDAPAKITDAQDVDITVTITDGCSSNNATMTLYLIPETTNPVLAYVGANTAKNAPLNTEDWTTVPVAQTTKVDLYNKLNEVYDVQATNIYASNDVAKVRAYYSQFDIIFITDYPDTKKIPAGVDKNDYTTKGFVNALGSLVDIRPILTMEAYVSPLHNWQVNGVPSSPATENQYEMLLMCQSHEIFKGTTYTAETIDGVEYSKVKIVDDTKYAAGAYANKNYGLQGFDASSLGSLLAIGKIHKKPHIESPAETNNDLYMACVEHQSVANARMMILGVNSYAMERLTPDGVTLIKNCLAYLLRTSNMDGNCSMTFDNGDGNAKTGVVKGDHDWNNMNNWGPLYNALPNATTEVRIAADCNISSLHPRVHYVKIKEDVKLTIAPDASLRVDGAVRQYKSGDVLSTSATDANQVLIQSNEDGNGALIYNGYDGDNNATVQMYSPAWGEDNGNGGLRNVQWQWMATPFSDVARSISCYELAWMYQFDNSTHGWDTKILRDDPVKPFVGYCITQAAPKTYTMQGNLVSTADKVVSLYKGINLIGNSWTAPINIGQFNPADFHGAHATIVMFNTGKDSLGSGDVYDSEVSRIAGTYVSIPVNTAGELDPTLQVIPSMQTFQVKTDASLINGQTLELHYDRLVRPKTGNVNIQPMRAPERRGAATVSDNGIDTRLRISVRGQRYSDFLYLFRNEATTMGFDNGWDGEKFYSSNYDIPVLYVENADGDWQISTQPSLAGTTFGFYQGEDLSYTIAFDYDGEERLWFYDSNTDQYTMVHSDSTYMFSSNYEDLQRRFMLTDYNPYYIEPIIPEIPDEPIDPIVTELTHVTVDGNMLTFTNTTHKPMSIAVYDAAGKLVTRTTTEAPLYQVELSDVQGVYMVHMSAGDKKIVTKVVR